MAIIVNAANPSGLLSEIKSAVSRGTVPTWSVDEDGDFTHSPEQWRLKAWFRPRLTASGIVFSILTPKGTNMSRTIYGTYHGRFIEMLLNHFDEKFQQAVATALPTQGDHVQG
ncbi:MAG TPA: hypothetical protein VEJ46_18560 [Candidatus Acidoferrum sp.]|nr:hypothetical protein [Candidatus Acidoferrum sp.]